MTRNLLGKLAVYVPLIIFAVITLIPFAYLASSAFKGKDIFFTSPFLPEAGLFAIDQSTGALTVVDHTLLPDDGAKVYQLDVAISRGGEAVGRTIRVGYGDHGEADIDFTIPAGVEVNQNIGTVAPPEELANVAEAGNGSGSQIGNGPLTFTIAAGNESGALGRAWGLLTTDNFERLFRGVPREVDGEVLLDEAGEPVLKSTGIKRAILNSFFFASVSSVLATLGAAMGGYALGKFRFKGRALIDNVVLGALVIPGTLLLVPGYQLLYWLGLLDTYAGLILPGIAPAFGVFLFRQAMISSLPDEMIEAARIDGCGEIKMFFIMALPMVRPMAGAFLLITYLGAWNNFIGPQIILQSPEKYPLAVWISQLRGVYGIDYGLIMAGTLVAIAPVLILFLLLQKEFIAGLTAGAVKG